MSVILEEPNGSRATRTDVDLPPSSEVQRVTVVGPLGATRIYERSHLENDVWVCRFAHAEPVAVAPRRVPREGEP